MGKILHASFREIFAFMLSLQDSYKAHKSLKLCEDRNDCRKVLSPIPTASSQDTVFQERSKTTLAFFDSEL